MKSMLIIQTKIFYERPDNDVDGEINQFLFDNNIDPTRFVNIIPSNGDESTYPSFLVVFRIEKNKIIKIRA